MGRRTLGGVRHAYLDGLNFLYKAAFGPRFKTKQVAKIMNKLVVLTNFNLDMHWCDPNRSPRLGVPCPL